MIPKEQIQRAKAIIVEIVRQSGGHLQNKTNLYKAFWKAHVASSAAGRRPLSVYPIARMPNGPGIHNFDHLLGELLTEEAVATDTVSAGSWQAFEFTLINENAYVGVLDEADKLSVREGVEYVEGLTASDVSDQSHVDSRSWRSTRDGGEVDPDLDAMSDEEFDSRTKSSARMQEILTQAKQTTA